ncbi:MAG: DUF6785 family protein [Candidatus Brocadiia bacterium]
MSWRAFIIGLILVAAASLLDPYTSLAKGWGWLNTTAFPNSAVLALVVLTLVVNVLIKLVRKGWALSQAELMLVWCMMIAAAVMPSAGFGRFWYSLIAGGPYMARRVDFDWEEPGGSLAEAPERLILTKNPRSVAAERYFEGSRGEARVPWHLWLRPLAWWALFLLFLYLSVFFLCSILRRQWVEVERLMFPLARVPLEFSEGSAGKGLLPDPFTSRAFLAGVIATTAFRLVRDLPLLFGAESAMSLTIPIQDVLRDTPLYFMYFENFNIWLAAIGFAFLVPADVSLSIWFFFLFSRVELLVAYWLALPEAGNTYGPMMQWQQVGAYIAFTVGALFMARRHLWAVARKALGRGGVDDSAEPVPYAVAFWGFWLGIAGCIWWYCYNGMTFRMALVVLALLFCWFIVYARMVAQGGLYAGRTVWGLQGVANGLTGGRLFTPQGALIVHMQSPLFVTGGTTVLAPMAINAFRISEVFGRRKRWLLPAMLAAMVVATVCATYTELSYAYKVGGANFADWWGQTTVPEGAFAGAQRFITQGSLAADLHLRPFLMGMFGMGFLMFMRARFYWWPVHSLGLLCASSWHAHRLWFPFLLGWLSKVSIMKFAGGRMLRSARYFFIGLILVEALFSGLSVIVRTLSGGTVPGF